MDSSLEFNPPISLPHHAPSLGHVEVKENGSESNGSESNGSESNGSGFHTFRSLPGDPHQGALQPQAYTKPITAGALLTAALQLRPGSSPSVLTQVLTQVLTTEVLTTEVLTQVLALARINPATDTPAIVDPDTLVQAPTTFWIVKLFDVPPASCEKAQRLCAASNDVVRAKWLRIYGCPWSAAWYMVVCARRGHIKFAKWLVESVGFNLSDVDILDDAVSANQFAFAEWVLRAGHPSMPTHELLATAAACGNIGAAKWILACPLLHWDDNRVAAGKGAQEGGIQEEGIQEQEEGAKEGNKEEEGAKEGKKEEDERARVLVQKWNGGQPLIMAARAGRIAFATWALEKAGCPWPAEYDKSVGMDAFYDDGEYGGWPLGSSNATRRCALSQAAKAGNVAFVLWAVHRGLPWNIRSRVMTSLAASGELQLARQVSALDCPWTDTLLAMQGKNVASVSAVARNKAFADWAVRQEKSIVASLHAGCGGASK
jgi:hypothetical protein